MFKRQASRPDQLPGEQTVNIDPAPCAHQASGYLPVRQVPERFVREVVVVGLENEEGDCWWYLTNVDRDTLDVTVRIVFQLQ